MSRPAICERMDGALADLSARYHGKRLPKAFYLNADDWAAFQATNPPMIETVWGNNPPQHLTEPAFEGIPVRETESPHSRLYDHTKAGRSMPVDPHALPAPKRRLEFDIPADAVFSVLDKLSRTRALTNRESLALAAAMKGRVLLSRREAARLGVRP